MNNRKNIALTCTNGVFMSPFAGKRVIRYFIGTFAILLLSCITLSSVVAETNALSPADALWKEARTALDSRRYANAEKLFDNFIKRNFNDERVPSARIYIGICDYNQNRPQRALDAWNRVVNAEIMHKRASPALLLGLEQLARHYRLQKNTAELEKILDHLLKMFPNEPLTVREHTVSARACLESGDYVKAAGLYGKVSSSLKGRDTEDYRLAKELTAPGGSVAAILESANRQLADDSVSVASRMFEEVLKRNPSADERYEAMTMLGWCLYLEKEFSKGEKLWNDVLAAAPKGNEWRARSRWKLVRLKAGYAGQPYKAIELCEEQAREFPDCSYGERALFIRAWLYWTRKDWKKARAAFDDLFASFPEMANDPPVQNYVRQCDEGIAAGR